jgi:hypothetical protein
LPGISKGQAEEPGGAQVVEVLEREAGLAVVPFSALGEAPGQLAGGFEPLRLGLGQRGLHAVGC